MKFSFSALPILLFSLLVLSQPLQSGVTIGIEQATIDGEANHLNIFYTATSDYLTPPFNFWNSQLFTLRWSTTLGSEVIRSVTNKSTFTFAPDGVATDGGDGFYYQKFTSSSTSVVLSIASDAKADVLTLEVVHPTMSAGDFELITAPNDWVETNFGRASVNAAVGGEQFSGFAPALASGIALPVELVSMEATARDKDILVSWAVGPEHLSHYEIERSLIESGSLAQFRKSGIQPARNLGNQGYAFVDPDVAVGRWYYYRIKLVEFDGTYSYSPVSAARLSGDHLAASLNLYPNPTRDEVQLSFASSKAQAVMMILRNPVGRTIDRRSVTLTEGANKLLVRLGSYPAGQYNIQLIAENGQSLGSARCIKIK